MGQDPRHHCRTDGSAGGVLWPIKAPLIFHIVEQPDTHTPNKSDRNDRMAPKPEIRQVDRF